MSSLNSDHAHLLYFLLKKEVVWICSFYFAWFLSDSRKKPDFFLIVLIFEYCKKSQKAYGIELQRTKKPIK